MSVQPVSYVLPGLSFACRAPRTASLLRGLALKSPHSPSRWRWEESRSETKSPVQGRRIGGQEPGLSNLVLFHALPSAKETAAAALGHG